DRVPTQNQASEKQQEAEEVKSARIRHGYAWEEPDHLDPIPKTNNDDCPKKNKRAPVTGNSLRLGAPSQRQIKLRKTVDRRQDQWIRQSHRLLQKDRAEKDRPSLSNKYKVSFHPSRIFRGRDAHRQ